jgi:hypothetical protein
MCTVTNNLFNWIPINMIVKYVIRMLVINSFFKQILQIVKPLNIESKISETIKAFIKVFNKKYLIVLLLIKYNLIGNHTEK